jgi:hypothetical protein
MRRAGDHFSGDLFGPWDYLGQKRKQMLEKGWAGLFRRQVLRHLPVGAVAGCFDGVMGRPTKDLYVALGVILLQQVHDTSDVATVHAVAFDISWQYALDIRQEQQAFFSERTIRNYRRLIMDRGLDAVLFRQITDHLIKVFGVDTGKQRIDSTALRSRMRKLGRLGTFTETIEVFLRQLAKAFPAEHKQLDAQLAQRYVDGGKRMCFGLAGRPSEAQRHLQQAAEDLLFLVRRFAGMEAAKLKGYGLLKRILAEHCEVQAEEGQEKLVLKEMSQISGDSLQNPSDPDATYNGHKGAGFLMQVMETYGTQPPAEGQKDKPDLITHVSVNAMTRHDAEALVPALADTAERGIAPQEALGDTHYGVGDNPQKAAERGVELISPAQPPKAYKQGKLSLENFVLDGQGLVVNCPAGCKPISVSATEKNYQALFDARVCEACPLRANCPVQQPREVEGPTMRLQYDRPRLEMFGRRMQEKTEQFTGRYRWRAGAEGTMSRLKYQMGLAWLRVRGLAAVTYKAFMAALGLNILRCAAAA